MESAIPEHLREPNFEVRGTSPPFPAWSARLSSEIKTVVMVYFGVQSKKHETLEALEPALSRFKHEQGPIYWDLGSFTDLAGYYNLIAVAYWSSPEKYTEWQETSGFKKWWDSTEPEKSEYGYFMEVVSPDVDRFETVFSNRQSPEGVAYLGTGMSDGMIIEHGYWGSSRDRMPISQHDKLESQSTLKKTMNSGGRVQVSGKKNLCLIRSGQDWSETSDTEREKYLKEIEPVLADGMKFLAENSESTGCFSCRYMRVINPSTGDFVEKTFGLAQFTDLASLEYWSRKHPTHVKIFGAFMKYVKDLDFQIELKLWHEVVVIPEKSQFYEYVNCHPGTGVLNYYNKLD